MRGKQRGFESRADDGDGETLPLDLQYEPCCINYIGQSFEPQGPIHARYVICPSCKAKVRSDQAGHLREHTPAPPPYLGCPIDGPDCSGRYPRPAYNNPPCQNCANWMDDQHRDRMRERDDEQPHEEAFQEQTGWDAEEAWEDS